MVLVPVDPSLDRPLFRQLADELRDEIVSGKREPGSQLPTEAEFEDQYGISRTTIKAALRQLVGEGLVITRKGYGSYVRERPPLRRIGSTKRHPAWRASGKPIFDTEVEGQGLRASRRMLEIGRTVPPADVLEWLGGPEQPAVIRRRLQLVNDVPAVLSTSYYPLWLAEGTALEQSGALPKGPDALIEELGHRFVRTVEVVNARMPMPEEARLLSVPPGVPLVRMRHIDYDQDDRALQAADDLYVGDRHEFVFEWSNP